MLTLFTIILTPEILVNNTHVLYKVWMVVLLLLKSGMVNLGMPLINKKVLKFEKNTLYLRSWWEQGNYCYSIRL